jgi:hypothetical protein
MLDDGLGRPVSSRVVDGPDVAVGGALGVVHAAVTAMTTADSVTLCLVRAPSPEAIPRREHTPLEPQGRGRATASAVVMRVGDAYRGTCYRMARAVPARKGSGIADGAFFAGHCGCGAHRHRPTPHLFLAAFGWLAHRRCMGGSTPVPSRPNSPHSGIVGAQTRRYVR